MKPIVKLRYTIVLGVLVALACAIGIVWATSPHFIKCTATLQDGDLQVSWKEAGLGDNQLITYIASADATATYQCVNHGGNCPSDPKKVTVSGPVSAMGTFASGKNGSISGSLTVSPPAPPADFSCPGNQIATLSEVSYTNIKITDVTNGISCNPVPSSVSATFFVCP